MARDYPMIPAEEGEAQNALNDTFLGDPYPVEAVLLGIRHRSVQAIGAGLSTRNWHATETAYNELRDSLDRLLGRMAKATPGAETARADEAERALASGLRDMAESYVGKIEAAEAREAALRAALKPFCFGDPVIESILYDGMSDDDLATFTIKLGHIRRARAVLNPNQEPAR